ncbi:invasion associated locus B family protein [Thioalkalivibrio sp. ALE19]|uniref:invasion associated locus B family protein n=1 Tax=Thioalkalivibrio sp. ALE19 TaxID=1266909 RepID=UPI001E2A8A06|nr:invasion associated locus B family protein [Thioalkalivibrio sp. ALE19]
MLSTSHPSLFFSFVRPAVMLGALVALAPTIASGQQAQQPAPAPGQAPAQAPQPVQQEPEVTTHQDWESLCWELDDGGEFCQMQQTLQVENQGQQGPYLQTTVRSEGDRHVMELLLPLGVDLRPGIVMQVDEGEERNAGFVTCIQQGCVAATELTDEMLAELRGGRELNVGFRPLQSEQVLVFDVSLMGFTAASNRL